MCIRDSRRIDEDVSGFFFSTGDIYEEAAHHNAVFVGRDEDLSLIHIYTEERADHCCGAVFQSQRHRNILRQVAENLSLIHISCTAGALHLKKAA